MIKSNAHPRSGKAKPTSGWKPPYDDFPLSYHPPSGRLYKKIRGQRIYFGYGRDWQAALAKYQNEKDDWYAGRKPRAKRGVLTVEDLCEKFMASRDKRMQAGELSHLTFNSYYAVCKLVIAALGKNRAVESLEPMDFEDLRAKLARGVGKVSLVSRVDRARVLFNYASNNRLIPGRIEYGDSFRRPSRKTLRNDKADRGTRVYDREEVLALLAVVDVQWRAMILLGINGGLGNSDIANLRIRHLNLDGRWLDFPRPKTGIERRIPLWPETVEALREVLASERQAAIPEDADRVFLTEDGRPWNRTAALHSAVFLGWLKVAQKYREQQAKKAGRNVTKLPPMVRPGRGFYGLRHTVETVGGDAKDQVAVDAIMGHADDSMAANYRDRIEDERLRDVVDHIHAWLFGAAEGVR